MPDIELGIFVDPYASTKAKQKAYRIAERGSFVELSLPFKGLLPKGILVAGGEKPIQRVAQEMIDSGQVRPIGLLGGGTNNVLFNSLLMEGQFMNEINFRWTVTDGSFPNTAIIKPGLIGDRAFVIHAGLGNFEQRTGLVNDALRGRLPRKARPHVARLFAFIHTSLAEANGQLPADTYTISPRLARKKVFPQQPHQGNQVTRAYIDIEDRIERTKALIKTAIRWQLEKPSEWVKFEQRERFEVDYPHANLWIDGDTIPNTQRSPLVITRWDRGIPIVAIDY